MVSERIVEKFIQSLDASSGPGVTDIPTKVIKYCQNIVPILTSLFNQCIQTCTIPKEWKTALVTPLFKNKGDTTDLNNYRGISVIPPIAKLFEKILATQIKIHLKANEILFIGQHGFRDNHSCETALHELISDLNKTKDKKLISLLLFIDFRKAFDLVDPQLLLHKLQHIGFDQSALNLIKNYFTDRSQLVTLNGCSSIQLDNKLGVPQGSILGPLFFTIFINDLPFFLQNVKCLMFADDTTLYDEGKCLEKLIKKFEIYIKYLLEWCTYNKMDINWAKTFFMIVTNQRLKHPKSICILENRIHVVNSFKLLGVEIDNRLNFSEFVHQTKKDVNKKLFSIKKIFYLSKSVKIQFFKSFIMPHFDYCLSLTIYFPKSSIQTLSNCFYYCLYKLFKFKATCDPSETNNNLEKLSLFSFQHHIILKLFSFVHKIYQEINSPKNLKAQINQKKDTINYNLRSCNTFTQSQTKFSHYGEQTFNFFSSNLLNEFCPNDFLIKYELFRTIIFNNINIIYIKFIKVFKKYDIYYKNFDYLEN